ncbi:hypothetical protein CSC94_20105 [Zhengella mangrovi]|uniref:TRAP transporter small permease protein n=1 Tax=Zhengella mangrovi TaxID=1982044 RepID=A0A2G1QJ29_9HYPH|nr:TRAP transporter small permease subunit [Zhengella mangrovi]PHP65218.1 hypothetical protein CSC94_20105 [Zhengella mangrovi]
MTGAGGPVPGAARKGASPFLRLLAGLTFLLESSGKVIAVACLAFMFVALLTNVILRYAFDSGIPWAYEIHAVLLPWLVAGGLVIASARGRNIAITLLAEILQGRKRLVLQAIIQVTIIIIALGVLWSGQPILKASRFQTLSTLGIKQVWGYASLVYAFAAIALIAFADLVRVFRGIDVMDHDPENASLS